MLSYSSLASKVTTVGGVSVRDPALATIRNPWGYLLHTTGGGVTAKAKKTGRPPITIALEVYIASQNGSNGYMWGGPTYVCDFDGSLYQIAPDEAFTNHCGGPHRGEYLNGSWITKVSVETVSQWRNKWPGKKNPYHLFPSTSPNADYIGLEMIPIGDGFGGPPMGLGLRFTKAQHDTAALLGRDLGRRHNWPTGWAAGQRLLGHEDVDPIERSDARGGWDPGWMRAAPYFDMGYVRAQIQK